MRNIPDIQQFLQCTRLISTPKQWIHDKRNQTTPHGSIRLEHLMDETVDLRLYKLHRSEKKIRKKEVKKIGSVARFF